MYVTRSLSFYKGCPEALLEQPPRGSGFLVIQDEEDEVHRFNWFKPSKYPYLGYLPFPQDRRLITEIIVSSGFVKDPVFTPLHFLPVIDQPLSSNQYYVVIGEGRYQGLVSTCSTKADKRKRFFIKHIKDVKPREFDCKNTYQKMEIVPNTGFSKGTFHAKSIAPDGFPVNFLRVQAWGLFGSKEHVYPLSRADGIDEGLRASTPNKDFSGKSSPHAIVGKWYCPFIFVREDEMSFSDQLEKSIFYRMTLEQFYEEIYECKNHLHRDNVVNVRTSIETERSSLHLRGEEVVEGEEVEGVMWFKSMRQTSGGVGLDMVIVERMRWEEERGGWVKGNEKVESVEEFDGKISTWKKFRCFVLVERFALRRMDGTLIFTYDFKHAGKIFSKWE